MILKLALKSFNNKKMNKVTVIKNGDYQKIIWTKYFVITVSFIFLLEKNGKKYHIVVPKNFITDLGSIPPIFFSFDKAKYVSYIMHDFLYSFIWEIVSIYWKLEYDQEDADDFLHLWLRYEWMIEFGTIMVDIGLMIWWKYNYKKKNKEISNLKKILFCK